MIIKKTNYGLEVTIPETYHNSEFTYHLRMVKVLNKNFRWHPAIEELSKREEKLIRQFILRVHSMENVFKQMQATILDTYINEIICNISNRIHGSLSFYLCFQHRIRRIQIGTSSNQ